MQYVFCSPKDPTIYGDEMHEIMVAEVKDGKMLVNAHQPVDWPNLELAGGY